MIHENEEFVENLYYFKLHFENYQNPAFSGDLEEQRNLAEIRLRMVINMAIIFARDNNNPDQVEFRNWLKWNYTLIMNRYKRVLCMTPLGNFQEELDNELTNLCEQINELTEQNHEEELDTINNNNVAFRTMLNEYQHRFNVISTRNRQLRESELRAIRDYFTSILRKLIEIQSRNLYYEIEQRLEQDFRSIKERCEREGFSYLSNELNTEWNTFRSYIYELFQDDQHLEELQTQQINSALEAFNLNLERTFLEQLSRRAGELYESIREKLLEIHNNAFKITKIYYNTIMHPIETIKNIAHLIEHPIQTAKVALSWIKENPGKAIILCLLGAGTAIGIAGIATAIFNTSVPFIQALTIINTTDYVIAGGIGIGSILSVAGSNAAREIQSLEYNTVKNELTKREAIISAISEQERLVREATKNAVRTHRQRILQERNENNSSKNQPEESMRDKIREELDTRARDVLDMQQDIGDTLSLLANRQKNVQFNISSKNNSYLEFENLIESKKKRFFCFFNTTSNENEKLNTPILQIETEIDIKQIEIKNNYKDNLIKNAKDIKKDIVAKRNSSCSIEEIKKLTILSEKIEKLIKQVKKNKIPYEELETYLKEYCIENKKEHDEKKTLSIN